LFTAGFKFAVDWTLEGYQIEEFAYPHHLHNLHNQHRLPLLLYAHEFDEGSPWGAESLEAARNVAIN
jgi:hypothetical protein